MLRQDITVVMLQQYITVVMLQQYITVATLHQDITVACVGQLCHNVLSSRVEHVAAAPHTWQRPSNILIVCLSVLRKYASNRYYSIIPLVITCQLRIFQLTFVIP